MQRFPLTLGLPDWPCAICHSLAWERTPAGTVCGVCSRKGAPLRRKAELEHADQGVRAERTQAAWLDALEAVERADLAAWLAELQERRAAWAIFRQERGLQRFG